MLPVGVSLSFDFIVSKLLKIKVVPSLHLLAIN